MHLSVSVVSHPVLLFLRAYSHGGFCSVAIFQLVFIATAGVHVDAVQWGAPWDNAAMKVVV